MQKEQFNKWGRYPSLLLPALIVLLSACATPDKMKTEDVLPANIPKAMKLTIGGKDINFLLDNGSRLENTIKDFAKHDNSHSNLKQLIKRMRALNEETHNDDKAPGFTGIGGALGHEILGIAEEALDPAGHYDTKKSVVVSMVGKIIDYEFTGSVGKPGNGKLTVIVEVTSKVFRGNGRPKKKTVGYKWQIEVNENGFSVVEHSGDNSDPFEDTMDFSQEMLDRVEELGFRYKLWAEGEVIEVKNVWRKKNFTWEDANDPGYWGQPLSRTSNRWRRFYDSDVNSCIDMMFVDSPPATYADLREPPFYCLGRCKHPAIVNSR